VGAALRYRFAKVWTASLNYAFESFQKKDWQTDTLDPFQPGVSAIWLGNDPKNYDAHIVGVTLRYKFE
jgi:opacity protein-like surface antigen